MNRLEETIRANIAYEKPIGMIIRYNAARVDRRNKRFVFVEGKGDKEFYISTANERLNRQAYYLYSYRSDYIDGSEKIVGKASVLYCHEYMKYSSSLKSTMEKCIFIVDRDHDPDLQYTKYPIASEDKNHICRTKGYSFENYFLMEGNIQKVVKHLGLSNEEYKKFWEAFEKFWNTTVNYFAAKAVITINYNNNAIRPKYAMRYKGSDIFVYDTEKNIDVIHEKKREEFQRMSEYMEKFPSLLNAYKIIRKRIRNKPEIYMRGHDAYDYLKYYLKKEKGILFDDIEKKQLYKTIVLDMDVHIMQLDN